MPKMQPYTSFQEAWNDILRQIVLNGDRMKAGQGELFEVRGVSYTLYPAAKDAAKFISHPELRHNYYERILPKLEKLMPMMESKPSTKNAIVSLPIDGEEDPPCLGFIQFFPRIKGVDIAVYTRSSDVFNVLPFDVDSLIALRDKVAKELELPEGRFIHMIGSAHFYSKDEGAVRERLKEAQMLQE